MGEIITAAATCVFITLFGLAQDLYYYKFKQIRNLKVKSYIVN